MPADHFLIDAVHDILHGEETFLLRKARMKDDLQQHIAQLLFQVHHIILVDRIDHFIDLLQEIGTKRSMILRAIPGAAAGCQQHIHRLFERRQCERRRLLPSCFAAVEKEE